MIVGQLIKIYTRQFIFIRKDKYSYTFIDIITGDYDVMLHSNYEALTGKTETNKTYLDLVNNPKWVRAKIYSDLGVDYSLELK